MLSDLKEDLFSWRGGTAGVIVFSAFLAIIAIASTGWSVYLYDTEKVSSSPEGYERNENGLWETCECKTRNGNGELNATRAMVVIGLLATIAAVVMSLVFICVNKTQTRQFVAINISVCIAGAMFFLIGVSVYGGTHTGLNYSFAFTVLCIFLNITAAVLNFVMFRHMS